MGHKSSVLRLQEPKNKKSKVSVKNIQLLFERYMYYPEMDLEEKLNEVEKLWLPGLFKVWIYQCAIIPRIL